MAEYVLLDGTKKDLNLGFAEINTPVSGEKYQTKQKFIPAEKIYEYLNYPLIPNQMTIRKYFQFIERYGLFKFHHQLKDYNDAVKQVKPLEKKDGYIRMCKQHGVEYTDGMEKKILEFLNSPKDKLLIDTSMLSSDHIYDEMAIWRRPADNKDLDGVPEGYYTIGEYIPTSLAICKLENIIDLPIVFENDKCIIECGMVEEIQFLDNESTISLYNFIWGVIDSLCEMNCDPKGRI